IFGVVIICMVHFYEELQKARLARNLSLKEVSVATKISQVMLEALEQGRLHQLPEAYIRAFIREYARFLRLDEVEILQEYDTEFHGNHHHNHPPQPVAPPTMEEATAREIRIIHTEPPAPPTEPASRTIKPMRPPRTKRTDTNMTAIIAAIIVVVTGLIFVYFFFSSGSSDKKPTTVANQPPPPIVPQYTPPSVQTETNANATQAAQTSAATAYPKDSLTLEAATTDSVWVSVVGDTAHLQRGVIAKGAKKVWRTKNKFLLTVGNSKLISFTLNGKPLTYTDAATHVIRNIVVTANTTTLTSSDATQPAKSNTPAPIKKNVPAPGAQQGKPKTHAPIKVAPVQKDPTAPAKGKTTAQKTAKSSKTSKKRIKGPIPTIEKVPVQ
ncbi:MAG TPA: RodZ domain-containing protein, partial [Candidatus Kapabacteria bacterium]|nr:RodZ domain-containing protein [Candidatus Kapabacteria bacterium]